MVTDAEANAAGDQTRRDAIDAQSGRCVDLLGGENVHREQDQTRCRRRQPASDAALEAVKQAVKGEDVAAIRAATSELHEASHVMARSALQGEPGVRRRTAGPT